MSQRIKGTTYARTCELCRESQLQSTESRSKCLSFRFTFCSSEEHHGAILVWKRRGCQGEISLMASESLLYQLHPMSSQGAQNLAEHPRNQLNHLVFVGECKSAHYLNISAKSNFIQFIAFVQLYRCSLLFRFECSCISQSAFHIPLPISYFLVWISRSSSFNELIVAVVFCPILQYHWKFFRT